MATESSPAIDKTQVPDYPEDVPVRGPAAENDSGAMKHNGLRAQLSVHRQNLGLVQRRISGTVNVAQGSWEWGREMGGGDTLTIKLRQIYSGYRGNKNDNNSFNLYNRYGEIAFHVSFRRHDQTIRFNAWSRGRGWGEESRINFPQRLKDEGSIDMQILYYHQGFYDFIMDRGTTVSVDACEPPNSLTYRSSNDNDTMFGQNVDAVLDYYEQE